MRTPSSDFLLLLSMFTIFPLVNSEYCSKNISPPPKTTWPILEEKIKKQNQTTTTTKHQQQTE